jgi:uncharacterized membrane protein YfhO
MAKKKIKKQKIRTISPSIQQTAKPTGSLETNFKKRFSGVFEGKEIYFFLIILLFAGIYIYHDFLLFKNLFVYKDIGSDTYNLFNPQLVHFTDYWRTDGIPKWSFNQGMGQNVFPGGITDPFNIFLYLFNKDQISYAIVYAQFLKIILGGIIFFYYFRTMSLTRYASAIGALLFSLSGYMVLGGCWYGHSTLVVEGAFLLFAFERLYRQNSWIYFPIAVALISTDVFGLYIFSVFLFIYTLFRFYSDNSFRSPGIIRLLLKMAGLGLLGIAMNAVFIVSPLFQMINSPRVSGEAGLFDALKQAPVFGFAKPIELMTSVMRSFSSDLMDTGSQFKGWRNYLEAPIFYVGIITLLLIPQVFQFLDKKRKLIFGIFGGIWFLTIIFPYLRHSLYLFSGDYYKSGLSFFVPVTMLFMGINALSYIDRLGKINIKVLLVTFIVLLILLFYPYLPSSGNYINTGLRKGVIFFLVIYSIFIWLLGFKKLKSFAQAMLVVSIVIELAYFGSISTNDRMVLSKDEAEQKAGFNDYTIDAVNYLKSTDKSFYRINKVYYSGAAIHGSLNDAMIQGYYSTPSYQSFNQLNYIRFLSETNTIHANVESETRWSIGLLNRPLLQTFASVKYTLAKKTDRSLYGMNDSIASVGDVKIFKNKYYLPLGYALDTVIYQNNFKNISNLQKDKILFQAFVIDENQKEKFRDFPLLNLSDTTNGLSFEEFGRYISALKKDTLAITTHSQNIIKGKITFQKKKLLFFSIPYDKGWHAKVDGKDAELMLVNIGFMGLVLDKGQHEIVIEFQPPYVKESIYVSATGLLIFVVLILVSWRKKRFKSTSSSPNN